MVLVTFHRQVDVHSFALNAGHLIIYQCRKFQRMCLSGIFNRKILNVVICDSIFDFRDIQFCFIRGILMIFRRFCSATQLDIILLIKITIEKAFRVFKLYV